MSNRCSRTLPPLALLLTVAATAGAQQAAPPDSTAAIAAMRRLDFLTGEWEGTGWIRTGPGEPATFRQRETVRTGAGGTVLVIDGLGTSTRTGDEGRVVHQAFAVVSYDAAHSRYRWRAYRADGVELDVEPTIGADSLVWGFSPAPGMRVRFTIARAADGAWHEVGHLVREGAPESQFFEMTLRRPGGRAR